MNMFEELKAWANKWNVSYTVEEDPVMITIIFDGPDYQNARFSYNKDTGDYIWHCRH